MNDKLEQAKELIKNKEYKKALDIAKKRHGKDKIDEYLTILDLLIQENYLDAIEEKGHYHQHYDPNHDNDDYGEKYFDMYLNIEPKSINAICGKAMSLSNKNKLKEAIKYHYLESKEFLQELTRVTNNFNKKIGIVMINKY